MNSVAGDFAILTVVGIAVLARACAAGCHAKYRLPFPIAGKAITAAWDELEHEGWYVQDPGTTLRIEGSTQVHDFARKGVGFTFDECEANKN